MTSLTLRSFKGEKHKSFVTLPSPRLPFNNGETQHTETMEHINFPQDDDLQYGSNSGLCRKYDHRIYVRQSLIPLRVFPHCICFPSNSLIYTSYMALTPSRLWPLIYLVSKSWLNCDTLTDILLTLAVIRVHFWKYEKRMAIKGYIHCMYYTKLSTFNSVARQPFP